MPKEKMPVLGYVRVSTDNQLDNYSIEEQTERIKSYCKAKGWTLLHIYTDGGYSGGNTNRPALQKMLEAIKRGEAAAVVVYKLDRLSRSQKDTLTLIEDSFLSHNTDFISINENFDTSTPFGRAMIGMLSVFAQLEKDQITERFTMGRIGRSKAGYFHGGGNAPTGYDYKDGLLTVNEYEAMQIRELFDLFVSGKSANYISRYFEKKYTTKWSSAKVICTLRNSIYIGEVHFRKQSYPGVHQPIIDKKTYYEANRILSGSERENKKTTSQKSPFRAGYLLSSLIFCARCGARYSGNHGYYKCYSRAKSNRKFVLDPNCRNDNWRIEDLDTLVVEQIDHMISQKDIVNYVFGEKQEDRKGSDLDAVHKRLAEIDKQESKLLDLYQIGSIPFESITSRLNDLSSEKNVLQQELQKENDMSSGEKFLEAVHAYKDGFQSGDTDTRRLLLSSIVERITIDGKFVKVHWRI